MESISTDGSRGDSVQSAEPPGDVPEAEEIEKRLEDHAQQESSKLWLAIGLVMTPGGIYMATTSEEGLNLVNSTAILFGLFSLLRAFTLQKQGPVPPYVYIVAAILATAWAFINDMGLLAIILAAISVLLIARSFGNEGSGWSWRSFIPSLSMSGEVKVGGNNR